MCSQFFVLLWQKNLSFFPCGFSFFFGCACFLLRHGRFLNCWRILPLFGITRAMRILAVLLIASPFVARGAASSPVTFNRQIAPIIYQNCSSCHRPGEAAPFALLSYENVAKKGKTIARVTASRLMPPWKAEPVSYSFRDERRLTEDQIAMIQAWVNQGMPEGNAAEKPEPPTFSAGWQLGEPDLLVEMPAAYH